MASRLIECVVPPGAGERVERIALDHGARRCWRTAEAGGGEACRVLVGADRVEAVMDALEQAFGGDASFAAVALNAEAVWPRAAPPPAPEEAGRGAAEAPRAPRISRAELYDDVSAGAAATPVFLVQAALATVVAAIGLSRGLEAVVIGAMVIAPLLGPNMALALATTLGDVPLARRALRANLAGVGVSFVCALAAGMVWPADPTVDAIAARIAPELSDLALALASGVAGALAFTTGLPSALVGVMVAVALLPPLVVLAMMVGAGRWEAAWGALLLLSINVVCVNLAAVGTFLTLGVRPRTWWEADASRRATRVALAVWVGLLALLAVLLALAGGEATGVPKGL